MLSSKSFLVVSPENSWENTFANVSKTSPLETRYLAFWTKTVKLSLLPTILPFIPLKYGCKVNVISYESSSSLK